MRILILVTAMCVVGCLEQIEGAGSQVANLEDEDIRPRLSPNLERLRFTLGTWRCRGEYNATPTTTPHSNEATSTFTPTINGEWITLRYQERPSTGNPFPASTLDHMTLDDPGSPGAPAFGRRNFSDDKRGHAVGKFTLDAEPLTLAFDGLYTVPVPFPPFEITLPFRERVVRTADGNRFTTTASVDFGAGYAVFLVENCERAQ